MERERARVLLLSALADTETLQAIEQAWLGEGDESSSELHPVDQHQADAATDLHQREVDASLLAAERHRFSEVIDALERVEAGTYGRCATCGDVIPDQRLEAMPATRWCVHHELQHELEGVGPLRVWSPLVVLPGDDELVDDIELSPEELALHIESGSRSLTAQRLERHERGAADDG